MVMILYFPCIVIANTFSIGIRRIIIADIQNRREKNDRKRPKTTENDRSVIMIPIPVHLFLLSTIAFHFHPSLLVLL